MIQLVEDGSFIFDFFMIRLVDDGWLFHDSIDDDSLFVIHDIFVSRFPEEITPRERVELRERYLGHPQAKRMVKEVVARDFRADFLHHNKGFSGYVRVTTERKYHFLLGTQYFHIRGTKYHLKFVPHNPPH